MAKVFKETIEQPHPESPLEGHRVGEPLGGTSYVDQDIPMTSEVHTVEEIANNKLRS